MPFSWPRSGNTNCMSGGHGDFLSCHRRGAHFLDDTHLHSSLATVIVPNSTAAAPVSRLYIAPAIFIAPLRRRHGEARLQVGLTRRLCKSARSHHYRCGRSVWHAGCDQHDPDRRARRRFEVAGRGRGGRLMASPLPESLLDVSSLSESKMSHGMSNPPPLGRVRHPHLTSVRPSMMECFCTGIPHEESARKSHAPWRDLT
jgi:hypothetical protein